MSSSKRTFSVTTIGISDNERKILTNIFKLSLYRTRSYTLKDISVGGVAEIVVLDLERPGASEQWQKFNANNPQVPAVVITQNPPSQTQPYCIRRPFVASRVLECWIRFR